jgi:hypothetical protein
MERGIHVATNVSEWIYGRAVQREVHMISHFHLSG